MNPQRYLNFGFYESSNPHCLAVECQRCLLRRPAWAAIRSVPLLQWGPTKVAPASLK